MLQKRLWPNAGLSPYPSGHNSSLSGLARRARHAAGMKLVVFLKRLISLCCRYHVGDLVMVSWPKVESPLSWPARITDLRANGRILVTWLGDE